ncbi:ubiquinone/menaquinone biosynthesis methyltransferase [Egibacter rhizosphaerae]|uniref:ubiquinone/menaquinone biosynthesis methyltransferase n=1 Tax=Egibacter rhizosphaerae TaxID=1670831 RepID=UPI001F0E2840|nr:ubiquinone/menaquinone biosynthesis methyltransferase [Egibacter rhizosphaerae]
MSGRLARMDATRASARHEADFPLPDPETGPAKDAALVQRMFDRVAPRYDLVNALLSLGHDRHWRRVAVAAVAPRAAETIVDVAAGTGALAHELAAAAGDGATVVALDFSTAMLDAGAEREERGVPRRSGLAWVAGDGTRLPLPDASVDAVTIAFGLRNLPDPAAGLAEFARVTRPGGRLAVLEFSRPVHPAFRRVYDAYLGTVLPAVADRVSSAPAAYRYLAESIRRWPDQPRLAEHLLAGGGGT